MSHAADNSVARIRRRVAVFTDQGPPPLIFAGLRSIIAGVVLVVIALLLSRPLPRGGRVWLGLVLVGLSATCLGFFGMFIGGGQVSPGLATVIENTQPWGRDFLFALLTLSLLGTALASLLWFRLLHRASLGRLTTFSFLTPVFGLILGLTLFGERLGGVEILGIVVALFGVWQVTRSGHEHTGRTLCRSAE